MVCLRLVVNRIYNGTHPPVYVYVSTENTLVALEVLVRDALHLPPPSTMNLWIFDLERRSVLSDRVHFPLHFISLVDRASSDTDKTLQTRLQERDFLAYNSLLLPASSSSPFVPRDLFVYVDFAIPAGTSVDTLPYGDDAEIDQAYLDIVFE